MPEMPLTRAQIENIIETYELTISRLCGSDGVQASDFLRHDAALRAQLWEAQQAALHEGIISGELKAQLAAQTARAERLHQDRYDLLTVTSTDGLLSSEWLMRTATAERKVKDLTNRLAQVTQERDDQKKFAQDYYSEASKGWSKFRECEQQLAQVTRERDSIKEELEVSLQLTGSFFEALKPLSLSSIHVQNPGQHITDLIAQLAEAQARIATLEAALREQQTQMDFPGLPEAFSLTMKRLIDQALAPASETKGKEEG